MSNKGVYTVAEPLLRAVGAMISQEEKARLRPEQLNKLEESFLGHIENILATDRSQITTALEGLNNGCESDGLCKECVALLRERIRLPQKR